MNDDWYNEYITSDNYLDLDILLERNAGMVDDFFDHDDDDDEDIDFEDY